MFNSVDRSGPGLDSRATSFVQRGSKVYGEGGIESELLGWPKNDAGSSFRRKIRHLIRRRLGEERANCDVSPAWGSTVTAHRCRWRYYRERRGRKMERRVGWILQWIDGNSISRKLVFRFAAPAVCLGIVRSRSCHFGCAFEVDQERYLRVAETWRREERGERANVFLEYLQLIAYSART